MIDNNISHFLYQKHNQILALSKVPDQRKGEQFLLKFMDPIIRSARSGTNLKLNDEKVAKILVETKVRLERMRDVFADLIVHNEVETRSKCPVFRGGVHKASAISGA